MENQHLNKLQTDIDLDNKFSLIPFVRTDIALYFYHLYQIFPQIPTFMKILEAYSKKFLSRCVMIILSRLIVICPVLLIICSIACLKPQLVVTYTLINRVLFLSLNDTILPLQTTYTMRVLHLAVNFVFSLSHRLTTIH